MIRLKLLITLTFVLTVPAGTVFAQLSKVGVVDFQRAVVESAEGKDASSKFDAKLKERQAELEKRRAEIEAIQKRLQAQGNVLSDSVKAGLQRDIDRGQTDLTRMSEDVQKELETLRNDLLQPIAQRAGAILNAFAAEQGYTLIVDVSAPENNVIWRNPANDITTELIRRIDASAPKPAAPAATAKPPAPAPTPEKKP